MPPEDATPPNKKNTGKAGAADAAPALAPPAADAPPAAPPAAAPAVLVAPPEPSNGELLARIAELEQRLNSQEASPAVDAPPRIPRLVTSVPLYDTDAPETWLERARSAMQGNIDPSRASRFKTDARIYAGPEWPLAKRLGKREVPVGTEFDASEIPEADRKKYAAQQCIVAIG